MDGDSTSTSLILRLRQESTDQQAWQTVNDLYRPLILKWCVQKGVQASNADDICQDVLLKVTSKISQFKKRSAGGFRGWLRTITEREILMRYRRSARLRMAGQGELPAVGGTDHRLRIEQASSPDPDVESDVAEHAAVLGRALQLIRNEIPNDKTWDIFWQFAVMRRPAAEIAQEFGMEPNAIRQIKIRVVMKLRKKYGDFLELPV